MRGKARRVWIATCWICNRKVCHEGYKKKFLQKLNDEGWKKHYDTWCCPNHEEIVSIVGVQR